MTLEKSSGFFFTLHFACGETWTLICLKGTGYRAEPELFGLNLWAYFLYFKNGRLLVTSYGL